MLDISFFMRFDSVLDRIQKGEISSKEGLFEALEEIRSPNPIVYNIETTNRCNMSCQMCPRTSLMTRKLEDIPYGLFSEIVDQISPHNAGDWTRWKSYCENKYGISEDDLPSENHFFLYIISKVIQLHGYGDPLLDKNMASFVSLLKKKGIPTYFSCNPTNINLKQTYDILESGLDYIKYSIESTEPAVHNAVRGGKTSILDAIENIIRVIEYKERQHLSTVIVITMIDLNRKNQYEEFVKLRSLFQGYNVYLYLKSEDSQWFRQDYHENKSIHWNEPCKHPWMTMTIKSNGEVAMCMEDYNNDIVLGNVSTASLFDIWNGPSYRQFRWNHINPPLCARCSEKCDMTLVGSLLPVI